MIKSYVPRKTAPLIKIISAGQILNLGSTNPGVGGQILNLPNGPSGGGQFYVMIPQSPVDVTHQKIAPRAHGATLVIFFVACVLETKNVFSICH